MPHFLHASGILSGEKFICVKQTKEKAADACCAVKSLEETNKMKRSQVEVKMLGLAEDRPTKKRVTRGKAHVEEKE